MYNKITEFSLKQLENEKGTMVVTISGKYKDILSMIITAMDKSDNAKLAILDACEIFTKSKKK
jgi:hypothetical protein